MITRSGEEMHAPLIEDLCYGGLRISIDRKTNHIELSFRPVWFTKQVDAGIYKNLHGCNNNCSRKKEAFA
jgi:hypothetical protein